VELQAIRESSLGPPMTARALAIVHTCMYDAWADYDPVAVGTRLGDTLRRPPRERTLANKALHGSTYMMPSRLRATGHATLLTDTPS
jgi:hypothetical protein